MTTPVKLLLGHPENGMMFTIEHGTVRLTAVHVNPGVNQDAAGWGGYLCFAELPDRPATEDERRVLGRLFAARELTDQHRVYGWVFSRNGHQSLYGRMRNCQHPPAIGAEVARWAFAGMTPQQVADTYGDGGKVYLNG